MGSQLCTLKVGVIVVRLFNTEDMWGASTWNSLNSGNIDIRETNQGTIAVIKVGGNERMDSGFSGSSRQELVDATYSAALEICGLTYEDMDMLPWCNWLQNLWKYE